MAKIKFASKIACLSAKNMDIAYIEFGEAHHFFFARGSFATYERIDPIEVEKIETLAIYMQNDHFNLQSSSQRFQALTEPLSLNTSALFA